MINSSITSSTFTNKKFIVIYSLSPILLKYKYLLDVFSRSETKTRAVIPITIKDVIIEQYKDYHLSYFPEEHGDYQVVLVHF